MKTTTRAALGTLLAAALTLPSAVGADWLVTLDGERIETVGPWHVEGRRVLFTRPNGTLSSMRLSAIDLEASEQANLPQAEPESEAPAAAKPKLVLTNADVAHVQAPVSVRLPASDGASGDGESTGDAPAGENQAAAAAGAGEDEEDRDIARLVVASWQEESTDDGLRFIGALENRSPDFAVQLKLDASLYDEAGDLLDVRAARIVATALAPGRTTNFEVTFPEVFSYGEVRFSPFGRRVISRPPPATDDSTLDAQASAPPTEGPEG